MTHFRNALERRRASMLRNAQKPERPRYDPDNGWNALLADFAGLNGLRRSSEFTLDALSRGLCHGGAWGRAYDWCGCDHPSFFKRYGRTALVLTEPYRAHEVEALRAYATEKGLAFHTPPNPMASFWYPGFTYLVALTRPGEEVLWLPAQFDFCQFGFREMPDDLHQDTIITPGA